MVNRTSGGGRALPIGAHHVAVAAVVERALGAEVRPCVEPVDGLGEAQVGVDAGDHDARVDGQDLDPDE
jgi:hypothetical protein